MTKELKQFGIYTNEYFVKIIINIDDNEITSMEYPVNLFKSMNNSVIIDKLQSIITVRTGRTFIRSRVDELETINILKYAYLGQVEDQWLIDELRDVVDERKEEDAIYKF